MDRPSGAQPPSVRRRQRTARRLRRRAGAVKERPDVLQSFANARAARGPPMDFGAPRGHTALVSRPRAGAALLLAVALPACGSNGGATSPTTPGAAPRTYLMGFSAFPPRFGDDN